MTFRLPILMLLVTTGFMLFAQGQVPFIQQPLQPSAVVPGSRAFTLTVRGSEFVHGALVKWNDQPLATTFVSITELKVSVPTSYVADAGPAKINVWNTPNTPSNDAFLAITSRTRARFEQILRSTGDQAAQLVATDFNRDGNLDVAFVGISGVIEVFLNKGDGNFTAPVDYAITPGFNGGLVTADFNRDGKMDLAATEGVQPSLVAVLLGNGDGTFQPSLNFPVASFPRALAVGDFDRDGNLDILALCLADELSHGALSLLRGKGDGTFATHHDSSAVNNPISMSIDDFNRDGSLDVVIVGGSSPNATVFLGSGNGTFQSGLAYPLADTGTFITSADLNKDGYSDLVVTAVKGVADGVSVLLNQGDGTFGPPVLYNTPAFSSPASILVTDVDADGKQDIVTADGYDALAPGQISILEGNGDGSFQPHQDRNVAGYAPRGIIAGDVNSDGKPDLVVSYIQDFKLSTLRAK